MKILGIDIYSGNIDSKNQAKYSIALLENGEFKLLKDDVSRLNLIKLIRKLKPDIIACDNIFEIFPKEKMKRFFYLLPPNTKVVQVTGKFGEEVSLIHLAKKYGIEIKSKYNPIEEAKASALLAYKKVGYVIKFFEDRCKIIVSRARCPTKGGQSENRFRRKIHAMVWEHIKYVKEKLDELNLKYELKLIKADGGYSRGEFTVYAPREKIIGIRKKKGGDVQIKIIPIERNEIEFEPLAKIDIPVILGIDPGSTVAVAAIDINGNLVEVHSSKNLSLEDLVRYVSKFKRILICSVDVNPAPRIVEKLSSILNTILFVPNDSMSVEEKIRIVDETYGKKCYSNNHERDAIAAALKAYKYYKNKIKNILNKIMEFDEEKKYEILERVLKGEVLENIMKEYKSDTQTKDFMEKNVPSNNTRKPNLEKYIEEIRRLKYDVEILKRENEELKEIIRMKNMEIEKLKSKIEEMKTEIYKKILLEEEIRKRDKIIKELVDELNREKKEKEELIKKLKKEELKIDKENFEEVFVIENFAWNSMDEIRDKRNVVIYVKNSSGGGRKIAQELLELKPIAIIAKKSKMSHIMKEMLNEVLIDEDEIEIIKINDKYYVDKDELKKLLEKKRKENLEKIINQYKFKFI